MDTKGWERRGKSAAGKVRRETRSSAVDRHLPEILRRRTERRETIESLAASFEVTVRAMAELLKRHGLSRLEPQGRKRPEPKGRTPGGTAKLDAAKERVRSMAEDFRSGAYIAREMQVSEHVLYQWLSDNAIVLIPLNDDQREIVRLWRTSDLNMRAIARKLGYAGVSSVSNVLKRTGLIDRTGQMGRRHGSSYGKRGVDDLCQPYNASGL